jgi:r1t holin
VSIWTKAFWRATTERGVRAFAWALSATLGGGALNIVEAPWRGALGVGAMAAVLSVLASLTVNQATGDGPALTSAEHVNDNA